MSKKFKYKGFSRLSSIICINVVAITLLGISYGQWSNILTVNGKVSTGVLSVEGIIDEMASWPIRIERVNLEPSATGYYKGSVDIIFSVENTGDVAALISLNEDITGNSDRNTWFKFTNGDTVILECLMPVENKKFDVNIVNEESTVISQNLWDVEEFLLGPGERATVTLKEWGFEVALGEALEQIEMEAQVNLLYKDTTGAWYGDTSNSLYIRQSLSEVYDIATLEIAVPPLIPESDIIETLPTDEEELEVDMPVTLPSDEGELEIDVPVTIPSGEEELEVDVPVTIPSGEEELAVDIPVTISSDEEAVITEEIHTPVILPSEPVQGEVVGEATTIE